MVNGKVAVSGDRDLIKKVDTKGYEWIKTELGIEIEKEENYNTVSIGTCATKEVLKGNK